MKKIFFPLIISIIAFSLLTGCSIPLTPSYFDTNEMVPFSDEQNDFTIIYPTSWTARTSPDGYRGDEEITALIYTPSTISSVIFIARKTLDTPTLDEAASWGEERIKNQFAYTEIGTLKPKVLSNGLNALERISYSNPNSTSSVRITDIYILKEDEGIIIQFSIKENLYDQVSETFDAMINSIELSENN